MNKRGKMIRYVGIVCWFLALFFLIQSGQEKRRAKEAEEAQQNAIVSQMDEEVDMDSTIIFPSED